MSPALCSEGSRVMQARRVKVRRVKVLGNLNTPSLHKTTCRIALGPLGHAVLCRQCHQVSLNLPETVTCSRESSTP